MNKALFLTLDETLITTLSGRKFALHGEDWKFILQTVEAIKDFYSKGYYICIITNQTNVLNNPLAEKAFLRKMKLVLDTLEKDIKIKHNKISYFYCIDEASYNYLPRPGMIYEYAVDHEIDIVNSTLLGGSIYDRAIAVYAGISNYIDKTNLNYPI